MNVTPPTLQKHSTGQYFVKWGGKFRYLGSDRVEASRLFLVELEEWAAWRQDRAKGRQLTAKRGLRLIDVYEQFIQSRAAECREITHRFYRQSLRHFLLTCGEIPANKLTAHVLQAWKEDRLRTQYAKKEGDTPKPIARKTVNHELGCIKTMLQWAIDFDLIHAVNLRAVKSMRLPAPAPKGYTIAQVKKFYRKADAPLKHWLAVNWLTACRPMECLRIVHGQGDWIGDGLFRLATDKTSEASGVPRVLLCSQLCLSHLRRAKPAWNRGDGYYLAWRRQLGLGGPHPLRHGAAMQLALLGVPRADIDLVLGHSPPRVSVTYNPVDWKSLRAVASRLTL